MLDADSKKNLSPAAKMLLHVFAAGAFLLAATNARAHEDPPGCFESGPGIVISVMRADGVTGLVGAASQCETITYRVTLRKAIESDEVCAFSGGTLTLTTPDGVVHDIDVNVPCIGGTTAPCDPAVDAVASGLISYTVNPADVIAGFAIASAHYTGGVLHDGDVDTSGVSAMAPKATPVVLCDDGDACSQNVCDPEQQGAAACSNPPIDCDDHNACTTDSCGDGVCNHVAPDPTCVPCEGPADCNDHNACTTDTCGENGTCERSTIPGCVPCETAAQCDDGNACTTDTCPAGACVHAAIDDCPIEVCADGDCANNPLCRTEICGNCIDDDGDGKVDYEDDDCCDNTGGMTIRKMTVRTKSEVGKNRLVFKALYSPRVDPDFNPATAGTTLQLRDADGNFFCQDIPFKSNPRRIKMGVFKFRDKTGLMAAGLRKAKFKIAKKDRHATFKTRGRKMAFREPVSNDVLVTLRVGSQCTQATAELHTKRAKIGKRLVYP
jgi:hypothetical protein